MKRPPLITFFASILLLEAFYELLLFPISAGNPQFAPFLEQLPVGLDILIPFGYAKGFYALLGGIGLWKGFRVTPMYLWIVTPLFPIASMVLTGSIQLAPFSILMALVYVFYLRKPDMAIWFNQDKVIILEKTPKTEAVVKEARKENFVSFGMFLGGYFLLNTISSLAMLRPPIDAQTGLLVVLELIFYGLITGLALRFGKYPAWKIKLANQVYYTGLVGLLFSLLLYSLLDSPQAEMMKEMMDGALTTRYVVMNGLYAVFLIAIGLPIRYNHIKSLSDKM